MNIFRLVLFLVEMKIDFSEMEETPFKSRTEGIEMAFNITSQWPFNIPFNIFYDDPTSDETLSTFCLQGPGASYLQREENGYVCDFSDMSKYILKYLCLILCKI